MLAPNAPEQLHTRPTLIGAPFAGAAVDALVDWLLDGLVDALLVVGLVAAGLLDEQATRTDAASVSAPIPDRHFLVRNTGPLSPFVPSSSDWLTDPLSRSRAGQ